MSFTAITNSSVYQSALKRIQQEADQRVLGACDELKRMMMADWEAQKVQLSGEVEAEFLREKEQALKDMREALFKEHKQEMEALRARFRLAFNTSQVMERSPSDSSLEKIERPDSAEPARAEQQLATLIAELQDKETAMEELRLHHKKELEELRQQYNRIQDESFKSMKTSLMAEKQVVFNEAVNKAIAEKEQIIQELRTRLASVQEDLEREQQRKGMTLSFSQPIIREPGSPMQTQASSDGFHMVSPTITRRNETMSTLGTSVVITPRSEAQGELETSLPNKEEEMGGLDQRLMAMSVTASTTAMIQQDKISVVACNVGDLVLLSYDDRHENYLVFNISSTYHFLHSDCLEALSLIPAPGEPRKNWTLGQIIEKEYCQARREPNRFHVPLGARFYRVRATPWTREHLLKKDQSTSSKKSSSSASSSETN